ncbi:MULTISPECIES: hypothetical protein [Shouchella]|uniref:Small multi-drug export protein n=2 Tax=Shouchella TaxID=2893057 RepID=A0ABY7VZE9_9BACI|nr:MULTISPECIES: hypothetical protein [Shouchella]MED4129757.1 hypothetical protein [Shouchella miscanthi]WDF02093.1 hypothetical protein PQ477_11215 [Shouchella hunanensis]GAF22922.1 hypothetical protein JCM19047_2703 [Bacillus sp. JCM 19047]
METFQNLLITLIEADTWVQYLSVFVISIIPFFESYVAVPIGILFGFPSIPVILIAAIANWLSVMIFIWLIAKFRKSNGKKSTKRYARAQGIFNKYGVAGLSFAGPIICYHVCAAISIASGAEKSYVSLWQGIAIGTWSIALGIAFHYGINLLEYVPNLNPFS